MGRRKGLAKKARFLAVADVMKILKGAYVGVDDCIEFVERNEEKVSEAYKVAVKARGSFVNSNDTVDGYRTILEVFQKRQAKYDNAYVTGFRRSGRN